MQTLKYKSDARPWNSAGGSFNEWFPNFIDKQGPNNGRVVVDYLQLHFEGSVTVATAALLGEDFYRFFRMITVKQKDGLIRYNELLGDALRIFNYATLGASKTKEHADQAVGANTQLRASCRVSFEKPFAHNPRDFSVAAELIQSIKIYNAAAGEFSLGASVVTINSGNYWVVAHCHEEMDIVHHACDEVKSQDLQSTLESPLSTSGRLQELYLYCRGAAGSLTLANLNEAWISSPLNVAPQLRVVPDLLEAYMHERDVATNLFSTKGNPVYSDPFIIVDTGGTPAIKAAAVLISKEQKVIDQPERDQVTVKTTQFAALPANLTMVCRIVKPRSPETEQALKTKYGLKGAYRVKTESNTMRAPGAWKPEHLRYMPIKFVA